MTNALANACKLLRIPFSVFLMPVYWFALSAAPALQLWRAAAVFLILHLLVYPASNGYNSYYDRDEGSIGGLRHPPKVTQTLYWLVLFLDVVSLSLAYLLSPAFAGMVLVYLLISKAYSYKGIRLKKHPYLSTFLVAFFQGAFTFVMIQIGSNVPSAQIWQPSNLQLAAVSSLLFTGSYPLTQIYQHQEDQKRGDKTLSLVLGFQGSFVFATIHFCLAILLLFYTYWLRHEVEYAFLFLLCMSPVIYIFIHWWHQVKQDKTKADFDHSMRMSATSSLCMTLAFLLILGLKH